MRVRMRTVLVSVTLALLLATVTIIGVTSYLSARETAEFLSANVLVQSGQRIEEQVRGELDLAVAQGTLDAALIGSGRVDPHDFDAVCDYFVDAIRARPQLSYLSWGLEENGSIVTIERRRDGTIYAMYLVRQPDQRLQLTTYRIENGKRTQVSVDPDKPNNDPRPRPYYTAARAAHAPTWTDTYVFLGNAGALTVPGVTRATPVFRPDGTLLGVLSADFDLYALSEFLAHLRLADHGFAFLVEFRTDGTRRVIAHPDPRKLARPGGEPVPADQIDDPRVRAILPFLSSTSEANTLVPMQFVAGSTTYVGGYRRVDGDRGLHWAAALVIPEDDIMGPVARSRRITIGITIASTILAVILAILLSVQIGRTLRMLASETEAIGKFHLQAKPAMKSSVVEVRQLAVAIEDMKTGLRSFQKFVPADLVRNLVASGHEAALGGERASVTVHFSDIADFTTISETMRPEELVELLSEYLSLMSREILASGGTIDKYIGDAVMAFWNAPRPVEDHAMVACRAILANHRALAKHRAIWVAAGKPSLHARVALHTGDAVVGNIGSEARLDFTAIGDTVNLASRLEGLNKAYGTELMISESTLALVEGRVVVRPLDRVAVKGKTRGSMIYELIGLTGEVDADVIQRAERHTGALDAYFARRWDEAIDLFAKDDAAATVIRKRAEAFRATPPPEDWDGIYRATSK